MITLNIIYFRITYRYNEREEYTTATKSLPVVSIAFSDEEFKHHYLNGVSWALYGDLAEISDAILVQYVRDNILGEAFDRPVTEDDVKRHTAFLVDWILNAQQGVQRG